MTRKIELTQGYFAIIDEKDYEKVSRYSWCVKHSHGLHYAVANLRNGKWGLLHRFILDAPVGLQVDHINHNGLDNRRSNLRLVDHTHNLLNRQAAKGYNRENIKGKNGQIYLGFRIKIAAYGKQIFRKWVKTEKEAIKVRDEAFKRLIKWD